MKIKKIYLEEKKKKKIQRYQLNFFFLSFFKFRLMNYNFENIKFIF